VNAGFCEKMEVLAYHLEDLGVPLVVRVPQVGYPWATLMQDTLDITGAGYEYYFTWLYILEIDYSRGEQLSARGSIQDKSSNLQFPPYYSKC